MPIEDIKEMVDTKITIVQEMETITAILPTLLKVLEEVTQVQEVKPSTPSNYGLFIFHCNQHFSESLPDNHLSLSCIRSSSPLLFSFPSKFSAQLSIMSKSPSLLFTVLSSLSSPMLLHYLPLCSSVPSCSELYIVSIPFSFLSLSLIRDCRFLNLKRRNASRAEKN